MGLKWTDYAEIAEELAPLYPDMDLADIDYEDLTKKIVALPDFEDSEKCPDENLLDAVYSVMTELVYGKETDEVSSIDQD
ncbi:MAG: Fe-S cluster assembly protein IscX [Alphaproteobacteria bacterium]|nr:Fe-S cluster assembly protein IscX [Alphaproteobacteria bacterium]